MNILVFGAGYVGLSNAAVLSKKNKVDLVDINKKIINDLAKGEVHIDAPQLKARISEFNINYINDINDFDKYDLFILALPTNYDEVTNNFDTSILDNEIRKIRESSKSPILIKSTIPVGYTKKQNELYDNIVFSPEFLREGNALTDAENPTRIIVGSNSDKYKWIGKLFLETTLNKPNVLYMNSTEAETVKLFSNTYLAMRVAFVNELDSFALLKGIDSKKIIEGVTMDPRIGNQYFTPSSGYGGYCLPKDSKQLANEFKTIGMPNDLLDGIVASNKNRKLNIVRADIEKNIKEVVIQGIGHKPGVKNYRNSQNIELAKVYRENNIKVSLVDENFAGEIIEGFKIEKKK